MILDSFKLNGKVAIVTGSGRGLGQGMSIALAEAGTDIVGIDICPAPKTKARIESVGRKYFHIEANLMDIKSIDGIVEKTVNNYGHIDILVNNPDIIRREDSLKFSEKGRDEVMNINLKTVFFFSQAAANQYVKQNSGGKIINAASMLSFQGGIRVPSYIASKSGVAGITRFMANEWAQYNINANAIAPGCMATDNTAPLRADEKRSASILERIPAARWETPDDLMGTVVFLASEVSAYVNGYIVAVDGGWLAR